MSDDPIRSGLRAALREPPDGRPDLSAVTKLSRRYRMRSYVFRAVAAMAVAAAVAAPLAMLIPLLTSTRMSLRPPGERLREPPSPRRHLPGLTRRPTLREIE
jgi:hypothetical protein